MKNVRGFLSARLLMLLSAICGSGITIGVAHEQKSEIKESEINGYIFNVGQANFTLFECGKKVLIVDCGSKVKVSRLKKSDIQNNIISFLKEKKLITFQISM